jgi:hypothetical protein
VATKNQQTGMQGVFLVAAELAKRGYIASPTSRSSIGADILVTDQDCQNAYSVQVKTNKRTFSFWLLNKHSKTIKAKSHVYVLVNLKRDIIEYFVVPSKIVSDKMSIEKHKDNTWYSFSYKDAVPYRDKWEVFK